MRVLGIDIGGTGIKGAVVDVTNGELLTERIKMRTPQPATPDAVMRTCHHLIDQLGWDGGPVGCGFPAIIKDDICLSANNIDESWVGVDVAGLLRLHGHDEVHVVNDADAAALCEADFGAARGRSGTVLAVTIGTGIGCGLLRDGRLLPNCELGSAYMPQGVIAEHWASNKVRKEEGLDWPTFGARLNDVLVYFDTLLGVDHFIIGGGLSKRYELVADQISPSLSIHTATYHNAAGTIGAALYAHRQLAREKRHRHG